MSTTSQIVFTTDSMLKQQTLQKLKTEGNTLKALLQHTMKAYLQGKISLGIITDDDVWTQELQRDYDHKINDFKENKNIVHRDALVKKYS